MWSGSSGRPRFLASVTSAEEALIAAAAGADIIDAKNPAEGALGALPLATVGAIVAAIDARVPVSATVGDLPAEPEILCDALRAMAGTNVDLVKIGFFGGGNPQASIAALGRLQVTTCPVVGLLLADRDPDFNLVPAFAAAGFAGVMLDTADKTGRALPDVIDPRDIARFVEIARDHGLFVGLAGALRVQHIPVIAALSPDVIGFRGALCAGSRREGPLEEGAVRSVARELAVHARPFATRHAIPEATR